LLRDVLVTVISIDDDDDDVLVTVISLCYLQERSALEARLNKELLEANEANAALTNKVPRHCRRVCVVKCEKSLR